MTDEALVKSFSRASFTSWLVQRLQTSVWTITLMYAAVAGCLGFVLLMRTISDTPISNLTRDPQAVANLPVYTGFLSNVGVVAWAGTTAICLFSYAMVRTRQDNNSDYFLLGGGLITGMLLFDDLFMVHEAVVPQLTGVDEETVYAIYVLLICAFLFRFRWTILRSDFLLLALAFAGFGMSIVLDLVQWLNFSPDTLYFIEDGSKFFGIVLWSTYFITMSAREVSSSRSRDQLVSNPR